MVRSTHNAAPHQPKRFAAFDIEVATVAADQDLRQHRPVAIACAAICTNDIGRPVLWFGTSRAGPAPYMHRAEVWRLVSYLGELTSRGYTLLTWDGLMFDWGLLAVESGDRAFCRQLALGHVDMMFHLVCARGHRLSLQRATRGMSLGGGMTGPNDSTAFRLWADGHHIAALGKLSHDVRLTLELADRCQDARELRWESQSRRPASLPLPDGWLTVGEARRLPTPNVTGLARPASRESLIAWMRDKPRGRPSANRFSSRFVR